MLCFPKVSHSLLNFMVFPAFRCQHYLILILQYRYKHRFLCDMYCWLIPRQHKQEKQIFVFIPSTVISRTTKKKHFIVAHTHLQFPLRLSVCWLVLEFCQGIASSVDPSSLCSFLSESQANMQHGEPPEGSKTRGKR